MRFDRNQNPRDQDKVAAGVDRAREDEILALAHRLAAGGDPGKVSSGQERPGFIERWRRAIEARLRERELDALDEALRARLD